MNFRIDPQDTFLVTAASQFPSTLRNQDFFWQQKRYQTCPKYPRQSRNLFKRPYIDEKIIESHELDERLKQLTKQSKRELVSQTEVRQQKKQFLDKIAQTQLNLQNTDNFLERFEQKLRDEEARRKRLERERLKRVQEAYKKDLETTFGFFKYDYSNIK